MDVDDRIRQKMLEEMKREGLTQVALAQRLDISPQALNQVIKRQKAKIPPSLVDVLDALDLELVVQPKEKRP